MTVWESAHKVDACLTNNGLVILAKAHMKELKATFSALERILSD